MATRKIATGTLVSIKADASHSRRRKPSEGGVGILQGRKKWRTVPINNSNNGDEEDTTSILTSTTTGTGTTVIRYTLDNHLLQDVAKEMVSVAMLDTTARCCTGADLQPSLLSASRAAGAATFQLSLLTTQHARQQQQSHQQQPKKYSHAWLLLAMKEKVKGGEWKHIAPLGCKKAHDSSGRLCRMESPSSTCQIVSKMPPHLGDVERKKAMELYIACHPNESAAALVAHAWGVTPHTIQGLFNKMCQSTTASAARKKRSDAGVTVVTLDNKRRAVYTAKFVFAKLLRSKHPDAKLTKQQIDKAWDGATQAKRDAAQGVQQGPFLIAELAKALSTTRGSVSWQTVATLVTGSGNLEMILHTTVVNLSCLCLTHPTL